MADFPLMALESLQSKEKWRDPIIKSYTRAGGFKGRRLQSVKKKGFPVELRTLTTTEKGTLETFYDANRLGTFNFWWADIPGTVYVVTFADELQWSRDMPIHWNVTVLLEVV